MQKLQYTATTKVLLYIRAQIMKPWSTYFSMNPWLIQEQANPIPEIFSKETFITQKKFIYIKKNLNRQAAKTRLSRKN